LIEIIIAYLNLITYVEVMTSKIREMNLLICFCTIYDEVFSAKLKIGSFTVI